ncbi:MAG: flagellar export protein FliJ [Deltaproteobacteria bacterium]|nr:flagellar export protein FliJ [Deltaproteobacteria bacterium]
MALFKFRLAPVLRYRERRKEEKESELRALLETRRRVDEEIRALERQWLSADESLARHEGQIFSAVELRLHSDYARQTAERIKMRQAALAKVLEKIAEKRGELLEARRAVKSLEQLHHRSATKFQREQNSAEQKFSDEIGLRQFAGSKSGKKIPR